MGDRTRGRAHVPGRRVRGLFRSEERHRARQEYRRGSRRAHRFPHGAARRVGTAIAQCDSERCIKVLLADSSAETKARIPARLEGYRVVVEVTGTIRPR